MTDRRRERRETVETGTNYFAFFTRSLRVSYVNCTHEARRRVEGEISLGIDRFSCRESGAARPASPFLLPPPLFSSRPTFYQELVKTRATLRRAINLS